ncbi:Rpn family recombination-promoting nuclease/putative transposase [Chlorogloeopsis sp. ULAP02]|uniref:Rpn family recombination-promoting nuclease/putative transposase n=1 Tax=Chlorogloeopsis sp. ULAP02 TaxID=3107926 RepID=UPI0031354C84
MKTDSIFYRLFQEFPDIFFELIGEATEEVNTYQFSSVEIKQTAFRIDGVFLPTHEESPIYFVEVQFQTDANIYARLFAEIFLYLRQNSPQNDWRGVLIYPSSSVDTSNIQHYREFFTSQRVLRIYLDELGEVTSLPISIATIKLVIEDEDIAISQARQLIDRTKQEISSEPKQRQLLELIETILVYKFPKMSREEIETMFGLSELKQTRFYQDAFQEGKQEGKQEAVPRLLALGLTVEQIAEALGLEVAQVREASQNQSSS